MDVTNLDPTTTIVASLGILAGSWVIAALITAPSAAPRQEAMPAHARADAQGNEAREARKSMNVQTLLFPRPKFSPSKAKTWAKSHGYHSGKVDITDRYVRLRQQDPSRFRTMRTISLGTGGVKAVVGR